MKNSRKAYTLGAFVYIAGTAVLFAIFLLMIAVNLGDATAQHIRENTERIILICVSFCIVSGIMYCYFYFENKKYILSVGKIVEVFLLLSLSLLIAFLIGKFVNVPSLLTAEEPTLYALYALMFLVGISIGSDKKALEALKHQNFKIILVPLATIIGTLAGSALISVILSGKSLTDCLAVGSGFGNYSLSTIFITQYKGAELGTIALVSNILRELIALLAAPLLVRYFGKLAPISVGGATTADTTLPIITKFCGKEFVIISIVHGILVDLSVPFLVTFFCTI